MEQAVNGKGEAARYQYNGLGHRVGKDIGKNDFQGVNEELDPVKRLQNQTINPEKRIQYTIDLTREYHNLLQKEEDSSKQRFLWDGNVAGMMADGKDSVNYYLQDDLGSPIRLTGDGEKLIETFGYDEFGQDLYENEKTSQPFGFTGYQADCVADTYFAQVREYGVKIGRFVAQDIFCGFSDMPFTLNQYGYSFNNPLVMVDMDGAWPKWIENAGKAISKGIDKVGTWVKDNKDNLIKIGIGVVGIGVGVAAVALTGGAAIPALIAGVKTAATVGAISAATSAGITATKSIISGDDLKTGAKKTLQSAFDGFSSGFKWGGILFGGSQIASAGFSQAAKMGVETGRKGGIYLTKNIKILSPNHPQFYETGGTLIKFGKNIRIDVGAHILLHLNILPTKILKTLPGPLGKLLDHIPIGKILSSLIPGLSVGLKEIDKCIDD